MIYHLGFSIGLPCLAGEDLEGWGKLKFGMRKVELRWALCGVGATGGGGRVARKEDVFCDRRWRIWGGPQVGESRLVKVNQANFFLKRGCEWEEAGNGTGCRGTEGGHFELGIARRLHVPPSGCLRQAMSLRSVLNDEFRMVRGGWEAEAGNGPMPDFGKSDKTKPFWDPFDRLFDKLRVFDWDRGWRIWGRVWMGKSNLIKVNQTKSGSKRRQRRSKWRNGTRSWRTWGKEEEKWRGGWRRGKRTRFFGHRIKDGGGRKSLPPFLAMNKPL